MSTAHAPRKALSIYFIIFAENSSFNSGKRLGKGVHETENKEN